MRKAERILNSSASVRLRAAAKSITLPKSKPRAIRKHFVVPAIRGAEVALVQRPGVGHRQDALKTLDFGNGLLGVHPVSISNIRGAVVNGVTSGG